MGIRSNAGAWGEVACRCRMGSKCQWGCKRPASHLLFLSLVFRLTAANGSSSTCSTAFRNIFSQSISCT